MVHAHVKAHQFRIDVTRLRAPQIPGQAGQCPGQGEGGQLVRKSGKTQSAHAVFVDADAGQRPTEGAPQQATQKGVDAQQAGEGEVIKDLFVVQVKPVRIGFEVDVNPVRAAQGFVVKEKIKYHLRKRHGHHDEVNAVRAHHQKTDHQGQQR